MFEAIGESSRSQMDLVDINFLHSAEAHLYGAQLVPGNNLLGQPIIISPGGRDAVFELNYSPDPTFSEQSQPEPDPEPQPEPQPFPPEPQPEPQPPPEPQPEPPPFPPPISKVNLIHSIFPFQITASELKSRNTKKINQRKVPDDRISPKEKDPNSEEWILRKSRGGSGSIPNLIRYSTKI